MISGAGGNWRRFDEKVDTSVIKQTSGLSCVSAIGEMLLQAQGISVSQSKLRDIIGEPADFGSLAQALNEFDQRPDGRIWRGLVTDDDGFEILIRDAILGVILCEPFLMGHAVLVTGSVRGILNIKDPLDQTSYKMHKTDFLAHWSGHAILRWFPLT